MQSRRLLGLRALAMLFALGAAEMPPATAAQKRGADVPEATTPSADYSKRHALVIGNATYPQAPLANPVNDARAMQSALTKAGFDVIALENASQAQMHEAI